MSEPRFSVREIASELFAEAERITSTQDALVRAGMRSAPSEDMIRRAAIFARGADLFLRLEPHGDAIRKMLRKGGDR